ncbi:MAG: hypothetical protein ABI234_14355 [Ktedonobacteraceae bacterium]
MADACPFAGKPLIHLGGGLHGTGGETVMPFFGLQVIFTSRRDLMGVLVNKKLTTVLAIMCRMLILTLNVVLLYQTLGGAML